MQVDPGVVCPPTPAVRRARHRATRDVNRNGRGAARPGPTRRGSGKGARDVEGSTIEKRGRGRRLQEGGRPGAGADSVLPDRTASSGFSVGRCSGSQP